MFTTLSSVPASLVHDARSIDEEAAWTVTNMEVNHTDVLRNFTPADAKRFVQAFKAGKR